MLVLSRKVGESIYLSDNIRIMILNVQAKQVKLGLSVPNDVLVYREELYIRCQEENRMSIYTQAADSLVAMKLWEKIK